MFSDPHITTHQSNTRVQLRELQPNYTQLRGFTGAMQASALCSNVPAGASGVRSLFNNNDDERSNNNTAMQNGDENNNNNDGGGGPINSSIDPQHPRSMQTGTLGFSPGISLAGCVQYKPKHPSLYLIHFSNFLLLNACIPEKTIISLYLLIWDFLLSQINIWTTTTWSNVWVVLPKPSWYEFLIRFLIWTPASKYSLNPTTFSDICVIYPCSHICNCLKIPKRPKLTNIVINLISKRSSTDAANEFQWTSENFLD